MCDMTETIESYKESVAKLNERIQELHRKIDNLGEGESAHFLIERRYLLYTEIWDMERAIASMQEYMNSVKSRAPSHTHVA